ncbi:hypothetical protein BDP81DRAFT_455270 [Colletotrichum phormii]|uniref:Uncharacterized protein n=1 Tax=Colletotrichum phormii TaxID=359342 RepID=A0AAI9ZF61_9PEZI|nr:uncharacterized protein BDP81DRAFT_455270 [Colletotrichum phormii]KAK1622465.1 hypothetical protein BDP81DRAFT_455270 [Colletotrichum phormii]
MVDRKFKFEIITTTKTNDELRRAKNLCTTEYNKCEISEQAIRGLCSNIGQTAGKSLSHERAHHDEDSFWAQPETGPPGETASPGTRNCQLLISRRHPRERATKEKLTRVKAWYAQDIAERTNFILTTTTSNNLIDDPANMICMDLKLHKYLTDVSCHEAHEIRRRKGFAGCQEITFHWLRWTTLEGMLADANYTTDPCEHIQPLDHETAFSLETGYSVDDRQTIKIFAECEADVPNYDLLQLHANLLTALSLTADVGLKLYESDDDGWIIHDEIRYGKSHKRTEIPNTEIARTYRCSVSSQLILPPLCPYCIIFDSTLALRESRDGYTTRSNSRQALNSPLHDDKTEIGHRRRGNLGQETIRNCVRLTVGVRIPYSATDV